MKKASRCSGVTSLLHHLLATMKYRELHPWSVSPSEAVQIQRELRSRIRVERFRPGSVELIAGADVSYDRHADFAHAVFVVLERTTLKRVAVASAVAPLNFPYIPGLLTFREAGPLLEAWKRLEVDPDVVIFDGQGIAHPRRMGIAAHMGLLIDRPSIGCGKSLLCGHYTNLGEKAGSVAPLIDRGEVIGAAVRTRDRVNPVFVSPGHQIDLAPSVELVLVATRGYRIPEPTRQAHLLANERRRQAA